MVMDAMNGTVWYGMLWYGMVVTLLRKTMRLFFILAIVTFILVADTRHYTLQRRSVGPSARNIYEIKFFLVFYRSL